MKMGSRLPVCTPPVGPYWGRRAVLATMHGKEAAVQPPFRDGLGLTVWTPPGLDTDALGTFTGETQRVGTISETALAKAQLGMAAASASIGIASEGSYGPHPHMPFVAIGIEVMVLIDDERGIVVREQMIDEAPMFDHMIVNDEAALEPFLARIGFPGHAVVVQPHQPDDDGQLFFKGIRDRDELGRALSKAADGSVDKRAFIQTDMRAHMNPSRMAALSCLAHKLCARLTSLCPGCSSPGFGIVKIEQGLPCAGCGASSLMARHRIFGCAACDYRETRPREDGCTEADPGHCPRCNP